MGSFDFVIVTPILKLLLMEKWLYLWWFKHTFLLLFFSEYQQGDRTEAQNVEKLAFKSISVDNFFFENEQNNE